MSFADRVIVTAGIITAAAGILLMIVPGIAAGLTTSDIVVSVLGVVALAQASAAAVTHYRAPRRWAETPDPEQRAGAAPPGASFDAALNRLDSTVRDRLHAAAVAVLTTFGDYTATEAQEYLEQGTWTDDRQAAAFFSSEISADRLRRPTWLGGQPVVVDQAHATVSALTEVVREQSVRTSVFADPDENDDGDEEWAWPENSAGDEGDRHSAKADDAADSRDRLPDPQSITARRTRRWYGIDALALLAVAVGIVVKEPPLLLVGTVGIAVTAYAAYGRAGTPASLDLDLERVVAAGRTTPGDEVPVVVTLRNESGRLLPDLRIVDGVPPGLIVVDGTPRHAAVLRPGETTRFTYTVRAEHGEHTFESAVIVARDVTGEREQVTRVAGEGDPITCRASPNLADGISLRSETTDYPGHIQTDKRGGGIEFYSTREYRPSDPFASIDWKRLARTRELATIEFREEQMAKIVLIVDARGMAHRAPEWKGRSAVAASVEAADVLVHTLLDGNHQVGITALSFEDCWLAPGSGSDHRVRARQLLASHPWFATHTTNESVEDPFILSVQLARLRRRISDDAQAIVLSPLCDDDAAEFVRRLEAGGTSTTVVSPDPTTETTAGRQLARIERLVRIASLRQVRIPVYEWSVNEPLELALSRDQSGVNR